MKGGSRDCVADIEIEMHSCIKGELPKRMRDPTRSGLDQKDLKKLCKLRKLQTKKCENLPVVVLQRLAKKKL